MLVFFFQRWTIFSSSWWNKSVVSIGLFRSVLYLDRIKGRRNWFNRRDCPHSNGRSIVYHALDPSVQGSMETLSLIFERLRSYDRVGEVGRGENHARDCRTDVRGWLFRVADAHVFASLMDKHTSPEKVINRCATMNLNGHLNLIDRKFLSFSTFRSKLFVHARIVLIDDEKVVEFVHFVKVKLRIFFFKFSIYISNLNKLNNNKICGRGRVLRRGNNQTWPRCLFLLQVS